MMIAESLRIPDSEGPFFSGRKVFCGFSGGADSLSLLLILQEAASRFHFSLEAVHFEHGFRGNESLEDAEFCRCLCKKNKIPFRLISLNVPAHKLPGESDEAAARRLRLENWKKIAGENSVVALGHHAGDLRENLFLRMFRGSNVSGLNSLRIHSIINGMAFYRPLLFHEKEELETFLRSQSQPWRVDSTNLDSEYRRNKLRNDFLPSVFQEFPYAENGLLRSAEALADDAAFIESAAETVYRSGNIHWNELPTALLCRLLRKFLSEKLGEEYIPDRNLIMRFQHLIQENDLAQKIPLTNIPDVFLKYSDRLGPVLVFPDEKKSFLWSWKNDPEMAFGPYRLHAEPVSEMPVIKDHWQAVFPADALPENLTVRSRGTGDTIIPFGRTDRVPLKKIISDVPSDGTARSTIPLLCDDKEILWIPGIRRSNCFPVNTEDRLVLFSAEK